MHILFNIIPQASSRYQHLEFVKHSRVLKFYSVVADAVAAECWPVCASGAEVTTND